QLQAGQAVGLQLERHLQAIARQHLVIGGVVIAGKGVFLSAQLAQDARAFARAKLGGAFEHHVFQRVGQPRGTGLFIAGADLVPELADHHRGALILADNDLEAVVEAEFMGGLGFGGQCQQRHKSAEQRGGAAVNRMRHKGTFRAARAVLTPAGGEMLGYSTEFTAATSVGPAPEKACIERARCGRGAVAWRPLEIFVPMFGSNDDKKPPVESGEKKGLFGWLRKKPKDEAQADQQPSPTEVAAEPLIKSEAPADLPAEVALDTPV